MANIKSQKKRIKTNEKARIRNVSYKSKLRTAVKNVKIACATNNKSLATEKLNLAFSIKISKYWLSILLDFLGSFGPAI